MKPHRLPQLPRNLSAIGLTAAFTSLVLTAAADTRPVVNSQPVPEREFRLFVGIDIKALWQEEFATVTDYVNERARLDAPDRPALPTSRLERVRFTHETKLSRAPLKIGEIKTELAWGTDEQANEWMRRQSALQSYSDDQVDILNNEVANSFGKDAGMQVQPDGSVVDFGDPSGDAVQNLNNFTANFSKLTDAANNPSSSSQPEGTHNSLIITTELSSTYPIADAYLVGLARIRVPDEAPSDVVFFRDVGSLGPKEKPIRIRKDNMPEGFELLDLDLHIYREGQEIASDRSEKQFALTRDEVLEYLTLERISSHRGETLPPEPVWSLAPVPLLASERPKDFDLPITVHVDAKGRLARIDESTVVPEHMVELVRDLAFVPALKDGVAVPGVARINLRDFYQ